MEKYAVDLEKVLDDFEYREKQSHTYSGDPSALNDSFSCNYSINDDAFPRHYRTPASSYRRPPFEPMNLADADFSITAKPVVLEKNDSISPLTVKTAIKKSNYESEPELQPANIDYSFTYNSSDKSDFKPDLIESNADFCSKLGDLGGVERNLPDIASANITSVKKAELVIGKGEKSSLDRHENALDGNVVNNSSTLKTNPSIALSCKKVISFQMSDDVTDYALTQYLEELVESEDTDSRNDQDVVSPDPSFQTDDMLEENTEITEDCSCSTTELDDKFANEIECSNSENVDLRKSSCSSENDNPDYHILSDNMLLISSSVDSQENLECDFSDNKIAADRSGRNDVSKCDCSSNPERDLSYVECKKSSDVESAVYAVRSDCKNDSLLCLRNEIQERNLVICEHEEDPNARRDRVKVTILTDELNNSPKVHIDREFRPSKPTSHRNVQICERQTRDDVCANSEPSNSKNDHASEIEPGEISADNESTLLFQKSPDIGNAEVHSRFVESSEGITTSMRGHEIDMRSSNFGDQNQMAKEIGHAIECSQTFFENSSFESLDSKLAILNLGSKNNVSSAQSKIGNSPPPDASEDLENLARDNALPINPNESNDAFGASSDVAVDGSQARPQRPDSLNLTHTTQTVDISSTSADSGSLLSAEERKVGKEAPYWMPDSDTTVCMHCQLKFNPVIRRRHHCRACGLVVCAKCSDKKASLEYLGFKEDRVCHTCHSILQRINNAESDVTSILKRPNPNNPMEYCSTIPPLLQVGSTHHPTPSVLVPKVGVLKREGRTKNNDSPKQVIFSDGIRPGGDLTELDVSFEPKLPLRRSTRITKCVGTPPGNATSHRRMLNPDTRSFIPSGSELPPIVTKAQGEYTFSELEKPLTVADESVKFAINRNLFVVVKRLMLNCCVHKDVWSVTTEGLSCVGQDEVVFVLEVLPDEKYPPKDLFATVNTLYQEASKGSTVAEMSYTAPCTNQLFESKEHGGFVFIRATYQCVQQLLLPKPPFLVALLIHRWETPWARLFPIRLVLRLGAEYRYYPCPLVSVRNRPALFSEIGHTIFTLLADFRKYTYTLPTVRGLMIHMEDRLTTILLPKNRYDQVIRALNKSEENVLAFAGNISTVADSHLVCIQSIQQEDTAYHTQAINILNKPRQVTGASFIVFNGSLKQNGWSGKSNIVEDGLMVQIPSESMSALRTALRQMKDYSIGCGPQAEEMVIVKWTSDDVNFNIGVKSEIDNQALDGIPSIRVHNGTDYSGTLRLIRWTEVFILQSDDESGNRTDDSINISKLSEAVAKATCMALVPLLDLLATANLTTLAVRATMHPENVGYEAGSRGEKLPPIYMKSLDEELIAVIHDAAISLRDILNPIVLELIFKVMEQG